MALTSCSPPDHLAGEAQPPSGALICRCPGRWCRAGLRVAASAAPSGTAWILVTGPGGRAQGGDGGGFTARPGDGGMRRQARIGRGLPFGDEVAVFKVAGRMFALVPLGPAPGSVSLKCDPGLAAGLRGRYAGITPGYHLNKRHWNTGRYTPPRPIHRFQALLLCRSGRSVTSAARPQQNAPTGSGPERSPSQRARTLPPDCAQLWSADAAPWSSRIVG
jgi:hypothetical protein